MTGQSARGWFFHPLAQAGIAIGVAGFGRIALNSVISVRFGTQVFGQYATTIAAIMLVGSLASAGPAAATTLGVARRWAAAPGTLPAALLRFLLMILLVFLALGVITGLVWPSLRGATPSWLWVASVACYVCYQSGRAFGYAVQEAGRVTKSEVLGAAVPLGVLVGLAVTARGVSSQTLVLVFTAGPATFLLASGMLFKDRVRLGTGEFSAPERRAALRESVIFFVGAGSSMAMQFLPVLIAGRLHATTAAALLFGAVQATTPLLLLSRIYGTIMMPAFAAERAEEESRRHLQYVRPFLAPSLALALGLAPWIPLSLGVRPDPSGISIGALVAIMTLLQVWATPAVTVLSARHRELVPALASLGGLALAGAVWVVAISTGAVALLPLGLALGAVVRSLVPMWIISGREVGRLDLGTLRLLALSVGLAVAVALLGQAGTGLALTGGAMLCAFGALGAFRGWTRLQERVG